MSKSMFLFILLSVLLVSCGKDGGTPTVDVPAIIGQDIRVEEGNASSDFLIDFRLSKASGEQVTGMVSTVEGTAKAGEDFVAISNAPIVFEPGEIRVAIRVTILGDEEAEEDETFSVVVKQADGATISEAEVEVTIQNDDISDEFELPQSGYATPEEYSGMTRIWHDEFDAQELSTNYWTYEIGNGSGGWGNNEWQYYRAENTSIKDGNLVIEARKEPFGGFNYTSSRIITKNKFDFQYGRVDIRAALPFGQGIWPALWLLGSNISSVGWPACGEIDIMEMIGGSGREKTVHGTAHWSNSGSHAQYGDSYSLSSGSFQDEYHVFSLVWDQNQIKWYVDDKLYNTLNITDPELSEFRRDFFVIFNLAVGGNWPGYPDNTTTFPQRLVVDYIRVFQKN